MSEGASAECQDFGYWCELDTGSHFCVLHAVPVLLFPDWKQEESVGSDSCGLSVQLPVWRLLQCR